jgi:hypothetical protein
MTDRDKAEQVLRKRRLAAKGLKEQPGGRAIDPMENFDPLDESATNADKTEREVAERTAVASIVTRRSG